MTLFDVGNHLSRLSRDARLLQMAAVGLNERDPKEIDVLRNAAIELADDIEDLTMLIEGSRPRHPAIDEKIAGHA